MIVLMNHPAASGSWDSRTEGEIPTMCLGQLQPPAKTTTAISLYMALSLSAGGWTNCSYLGDVRAVIGGEETEHDVVYLAAVYLPFITHEADDDVNSIGRDSQNHNIGFPQERQEDKSSHHTCGATLWKTLETPWSLFDTSDSSQAPSHSGLLRARASCTPTYLDLGLRAIHTHRHQKPLHQGPYQFWVFCKHFACWSPELSSTISASKFLVKERFLTLKSWTPTEKSLQEGKS